MESQLISNMFQAAIDTINGSESIKLTSSQLYAQGVLHASGSLKSVEGNEGLFSAMGSGLQKIWEYIKKMFSWIFGGESSKTSEGKVAEAKEQVVIAETAIKKARALPKQREMTDAEIQAAYNKLSPELKEQAEKAKKAFLDRAGLKLNENGKLEFKEEANKGLVEVQKLMEDVFELTVESSEELNKVQKDMHETIANLKKVSEVDGNFQTEIGNLFKGLNGLDTAISGIKSVDTAEQFLDKASIAIGDMSVAFAGISRSKGDYEKRIADTEKELNNPNANKAELTAKINDMKVRLTAVTDVYKLGGKLMDELNHAAKIIRKAVTVVI